MVGALVGHLWGAVGPGGVPGGALVGPWWGPGGALVGDWWGSGGALVGPWWGPCRGDGGGRRPPRVRATRPPRAPSSLPRGSSGGLFCRATKGWWIWGNVGKASGKLCKKSMAPQTGAGTRRPRHRLPPAADPPSWGKRQRTWTGRGPDAGRTIELKENGRGPDAGCTKGTDAGRTRAASFLPSGGGGRTRSN
eukprot:gene20720-biopygen8591